MNGREDCFISIYKFTMRHGVKLFGDAVEESAIVDKIFFDFDVEWGHELMQSLHDFFQKNNILHRVNFSGKHEDEKAMGFHVYCFVKGGIRYPKQAVSGFQRKIDKWLVKTIVEKHGKAAKEKMMREYRTGVPHVIDPTIIGDLVRIARVPNTWNPTQKYPVEIKDKFGKPTGEFEIKVKKRNIFCIPLTTETINLSSEEIFQLAKKPYKENGSFYFGKRLINLKPWDKPGVEYRDAVSYEANLIKPNYKAAENTPLPYCIRYLMGHPYLDWERRFWLIVCFRDWGFTPLESENLLQSFLDPEWFTHCVEPKNYLNIRRKEESEEWEKTSDFNYNLDAGEDMIYRVYYGNQKKAYFKDGCRFMRKISKCAKSEGLKCDLLHPVYFL